MNNFKQIARLIILCIPNIFLAQEDRIINTNFFVDSIRVENKNLIITTTPKNSVVKLAGRFELHNTKDSGINKITIKPLLEGHKIFLLDRNPNLMRKGSEERGYRTRFWACRERDEDLGFKKPVDKNKLVDVITAYPNPVNDLLQVDSESYKIVYFQLIDTQNNLLLEQQINTNNLQINLSTITKGHYYLKVQLENQTQETLQIFKN